MGLAEKGTSTSLRMERYLEISWSASLSRKNEQVLHGLEGPPEHQPKMD